jgi:hypothetical protein
MHTFHDTVYQFDPLTVWKCESSALGHMFLLTKVIWRPPKYI